jgi:ribosomal-protein-alanine N-acetyltransferase
MRFGTLPSVEGEAFALRPLDVSDAQAWFDYASLAKVQEHTSSNIQSVDEVRALIERTQVDDAAAPIQFSIRAAPQAPLLGTIGFHTISPINQTAEITYTIHPDWWGRGIAQTCCSAMVSWGFAERGFVRVQGTVLDTNPASARVLQRCGFALEGKLRNFRKVRGEPRDYWLYALTPDMLTTL